MSTMIKALIGIGGGLALVSLLLVFAVIGVRNDLARAENGLKAQYKQNQNNLATYTNTVREIAQVPDMARDDAAKLIRESMTGRYGAEGSKAVWQFITEQNPNVDPKLYQQIQQAMESGRRAFEAEQKTLLERKRLYQNELDTFPTGAIASVFGFPKINLDEFDIVINAETDEAFAKKRHEPMQLRESSK